MRSCLKSTVTFLGVASSPGLDDSPPLVRPSGRGP